MTINDIPVGAYLTLGQFGRRNRRTPEPVLWRKGSARNEFYGEEGLGSYASDEIEPQNESRDRRERGSNFFPQTNICQFLNSEEAEWFKPQHESDRVSYKLEKRQGFLHLFESWELSAIVPHEVVTIVPSGFKRKYGEQFKTMLKVSMLSKSQLFQNCDQNEGEFLEVFEMDGRIPTNFVTRTALNAGLLMINHNGQQTVKSPCIEENIIPFACFDGNCSVERTGDYYCLLPPAEVVREITDELHQLLK